MSSGQLAKLPMKLSTQFFDTFAHLQLLTAH